MNYPSRERVLELIEAGIRAPSADNRHRIWFESRPDGLSVRVDPALLGSDERHRTILTLFSVGAVVENILIRASALGLSGRLRFASDWRSTAPIADIGWTGDDVERDPLSDAIDSRHTNRRFFHGPPLDPGERQRLDAQTANTHDVQVHWFEGGRRTEVLRLVAAAESSRFAHAALHRELFEAIRFDIGWRDTCQEGLPPGSLEVEPFLRKPFAMLGNWNVMRRLRAVGVHRLLGMRAGYLPCRLCHHLCGITVAGDPERDAPVAGRIFQRFWLEATRLGLALQPLAAAAVLAWGPESGLATTLRTGWDRIIPGSAPLLLFRLGRARAPAVVTSRPPAESYLRQSCP
jgi:hypothetical protein